MNVLVFDVETTKIPAIHPWVKGAALVSVSVKEFVNREEVSVKTWFLNHKTAACTPFEQFKREFQGYLDRASIVVAHNAKFDWHWLIHTGVTCDIKKIWCTMVADYLLNAQKKIGYSLDACCARHGVEAKLDTMHEYWDAGLDTDVIPESILRAYNEQDVAITAELYFKQAERIVQEGLLPLANVNFSMSGMLAEMEYVGVPFDADRAKEFVTSYKTKLDRIDKKLQELFEYPINVGSTQQLSAALYGGAIKYRERETYQVRLKSGLVKERSRWAPAVKQLNGMGFLPIDGSEGAVEGTYSTSKDILPFLAPSTKEQRWVLNLLKMRSNVGQVVQTLQSKDGTKGWLSKVEADGRIHPTFNQCVAATGRLTSSNPNGQNLPRGKTSPLKKLIVSKRGRIVNVDLAQIEFRIAATLSGDNVMHNELFHDIDAHADNAIRYFKADPADPKFKQIRTDAKIFLFRMIYGGTPYGFAKDPKMPMFSTEEWENIVKLFYEKYAGLEEWQTENYEIAVRNGVLINPSGRILAFPLKRGYDGSYSIDKKKVCNYPVQSASADIMHLAMLVLRKRMLAANVKADILLQVHDSLVIDCELEDVDKLCELSIEVFESLPQLCEEYWNWHITVPLTGDCEVGDSYGSIKEYKKCKNCNTWGFDRTKVDCPQCSN